MKHKTTRLLASSLIVSILLVTSCTQAVTKEEELAPSTGEEAAPISVPVKVQFYSIADKERNLRGEFLGTVEYWGEGEIKINVTDANLERILKTDFSGVGGEVEEITLPSGKKVLRGGAKEYRAGTWEHLDEIINCSYSLGYIAELED